MRWLWAAGGFAALGTGLLGIFVPLLPTVPLVLLAAFCFSRSSERMHLWLLRHPVFGPAIVDWRESGAISRRGKRLATVSILAVFAISVALQIAPMLLLAQAFVLSGVLVFIWSRPSAWRTTPGTTDPDHRAYGSESPADPIRPPVRG